MGFALENHNHDAGKGLAVNTIPSGGLQVTAGNVGVGGAPFSYSGLAIQGTLTGANDSSGLSVPATLQPGGNGGILVGGSFAPTFALNGKTGITQKGIYSAPAFVAGSGADSYAAHFVASTAVTTGVNYGLYITAPSGGVTNNIGLYNAGTAAFIGAVQLGNTAGTSLTGYLRLLNSGGIGWRNAAGTDDGYIYLNSSDQFGLTINGTVTALLFANPTSGQTGLSIMRHNGTSATLQQVTLGAVDSGGAGFKLLRVPN